MDSNTILLGLAGVLAGAAPILFAVIGETIAERAGVINLSLNGTILLAAMGGFAIAVSTNNLIFGFLAGMIVGGLVALVVAFCSITLHQSQVAVGFVLTLLCRDLSYFLGNPYMGLAGPRLSSFAIPGLEQIPYLGMLLFRQDWMTYLSIILIFAAYFFIYKTRPGLMLRGIGERPSAAFARGANVNRMRYVYTVIGGMLVGLAGPVYSLSVKAGWKGTISGLDGIGWIALAITIFGGWNPLRAAFGAYLFAFLQWLGLILQAQLPNIPSQVLQVAPFPLMILTLLFVNIGNTEWIDRMLAGLNPTSRKAIAYLLRSLRASPPASLGIPFDQD
jgi:ABC-type uncharacterized transport system permease subunit